MKYLYMAGILTLAVFIAPVTVAQGRGANDTGFNDKSINKVCPISKEPVVASAGTVMHDGHAIGLCCAGCGNAFLAWDESRRDEFVRVALASAGPNQSAKIGLSAIAESPSADGAAPSFPYPIDTCIVTGQKLGSMGEPIVKSYNRREVKFCCQGCVPKFEAKPDDFWKQIDEKIIETQLMHYPIDTCIVLGGKLGSMGEPVNLVYNNRLVRFCCAGCEPKFKTDPAKFFAALDKKIIEQQVKTYPLDTCVVLGGKLGSMGEPVNYIHNNRLVRFCCAGCIGPFEADPAKYTAMIDKAYADSQRAAYPVDTCVVAGGKLGAMGEPVEIVAGNTLVRFCCKGCLPAFQKEPGKYLAKVRAD